MLYSVVRCVSIGGGLDTKHLETSGQEDAFALLAHSLQMEHLEPTCYDQLCLYFTCCIAKLNAHIGQTS